MGVNLWSRNTPSLPRGDNEGEAGQEKENKVHTRLNGREQGMYAPICADYSLTDPKEKSAPKQCSGRGRVVNVWTCCCHSHGFRSYLYTLVAWLIASNYRLVAYDYPHAVPIGNFKSQGALGGTLSLLSARQESHTETAITDKIP